MTRSSDHALRRLGYAICVFSILAAPVSMVLVAWAGALDQAIDNDSLVGAFTALCYGGIGLLLVRSDPRNRLVWFFIVVGGLSWACWTLATGVAEVVAAGQGVPYEAIDVSGWPPGAALVLAHVHTLWAFAFWGLPTLSLLLIPDGRLPSRRWLPVAVATWLAMAVQWLAFGAIWPLTSDEAIEAQGDWVAAAQGLGSLALLLSTVVSLLSLVLRYRRGDHMTRRRLRWVLLGGILFLVGLLSVDVVAESVGIIGDVPGSVFVPILVISLGMAVWRDQLFDVDVVISRTLLFGFLAVFIGAVYVGIVYGAGALIGEAEGGNQGLSLLATVVVAFAFQPVRRRLERAANRLVYGRRASPYEVLSDLSSRLGLAESTSGLLDRMVERLAAGTGAEQAVLWRASDGSDAAPVDDGEAGSIGGFEAAATWPAETDVAPIEQLPADAVLIERSGEQLGALTVTKRRGEELNPTERRLMADLAGSAGLVLDRARLDAALTGQAAALFRSRRRLVGAEDEERERLEQQLHTGTQQQLDRLSAKLDANAKLAAGEGLEPADGQLTALAAEARTAKEEIQALARGVYPPVLEADGLTAAVETLVVSLPITVQVQSITSRRFELHIELAVYFCIAEALTNVVKHARASTASVRLDHADQVLSFEVADNGIGMPSRTGNGSSTGLTGLTDRIEAVGGELTISSTPGHGTTVCGSVTIDATVKVG